MDGLRFVLEAPQLSHTHKQRPHLVTSCDNCCLKKIKCIQVKSHHRCEACEASNTHCQFRDQERYLAERSCIVTRSIGPSAVSPTRGDSDHSGVVESFSTNKASLLPVLPSIIRDSRYQGAVRVRVSPTIDPLGVNLESASSYQSQGWTVSAHPEGKRYAHIKSRSGITVITEANIAEPGVSDQLNAWLAIICDMAIMKHVQIPETSHLFLEIHQDSGTCNYYFADHGLRTVFWLDTISIGPSKSDNYLQYSLEENYWIHIELFPGTASQYSAKALSELQVVFSQVHADATSEVLTFPYTAKECGEFIDLLERSKDHASSPCVVTYVGRLWETVANYRFFVHSGDEHYQLSSNKFTSEAPGSKRSLALAIISKILLFSIPDHYEAQFKSFLVDEYVDTSRWHEHVAETVEDLKQIGSSILALLGASIPTMQMTPFSSLVKASVFLCAFNLAVTSFLLQQQRRLLSTNTSTSVAYLKDRNTSYGFQPIAIVHSLPHALFVWGLLLFSMQGLWMVFADLPLILLLSTLLPVAAILAMVWLGIWLVVRPRPDPIEGTVLRAPRSDPGEKQKESPAAETMV